ncbi:hypothetical protein M885DRAFT_532188 [Pelagophyceae sp. CCMP2097]|nr:hypothetical protein M885DRAFT_532188 [Pelagophyceae sp. CCMP2097]
MDLKHSYFIYARKACVDALSFALHKDDFSLVFSLVSTGRCPTKGFRERYEKAYAAFFAVEPENSLSDGSLARVRTLCDGDVDVRFLEDVVRCGGFQEWLAQVRHGFARLGALCRRHADRADAEAPEIFFCGLSLSSQPAADPSALYNVLALGNADVICRVLNFAVDAHSTRALVA